MFFADDFIGVLLVLIATGGGMLLGALLAGAAGGIFGFIAGGVLLTLLIAVAPK